jgi:hypothetical protein
MTTAYHKCANCGRDFADHNYVAGSIDEYTCPQPQQETVYGYFTGGDPRDFHPDFEDSTPEEIANWRAACIEANKLAVSRNLPCPSGWERLPDGSVAHVLRAPFGIGVSTISIESSFEPVDASDSEME